MLTSVVVLLQLHFEFFHGAVCWKGFSDFVTLGFAVSVVLVGRFEKRNHLEISYGNRLSDFV